jgi:hypothetical protein
MTNSSTQINSQFTLHKGSISILYLVSLKVFTMQGFLHGCPSPLIYTCNSSFLSQVYSQQHATTIPLLTWFITMQID